MTTEMTANVALYARQSSGADTEDKSESIQAQLDAMTAYAKGRGWNVIQTATDANISGRHYPNTIEAKQLANLDTAYHSHMGSNGQYRDGLAEIINNIDNIDIVLVYDATRLMRPLTNSFLQNYLYSVFIDSNTQLCIVGGNPQSFNDFSNLLLSNLDNLIQDRAVKLTAKKAKEAARKSRNEGNIWTGYFSNTYGYENVGKRKVRIVESEANTVRQIYDWFINGKSLTSILKELNTSKEHQPRRADKWSRRSVTLILSQSMYICKGTDTNGNTITIDAVPRIIDDIAFYKAQTINRNQKNHKGRKTRFVHPLSGLLYCGYCGEKLRIRYDAVAKNYTYICYNVLEHYNLDCIEDCKTTRVRDNAIGWDRWQSTQRSGMVQSLLPFALYGAFEAYLESLRDEETITAIGIAQAQLERLDTSLADIGQQIANDIIDSTSATIMMTPILQKKKEQLNRLKELENKRTATASDIFSFPFEDWFKIATQQLDDRHMLLQYRTLIHQAVDKVLVFTDYIEVLLNSGSVVTLPRIKSLNARTIPILSIGLLNASTDEGTKAIINNMDKSEDKIIKALTDVEQIPWRVYARYGKGKTKTTVFESITLVIDVMSD